jgi:hypothetical protein
MSPRIERALFMVWGWLAVPCVLGAIAAAFFTSVWFGAGFCLLTVVWLYDMGATTCSRCRSYGTGKCGTQSWIVPLIWRRKTSPASRFRVRLHLALDFLMMAVGLAAYARFPITLPFCLLWLVLGLWVVYLPRRNHGLLHRLREPQQPRGVMSLPVLPSASGPPGGAGRA